jgi:hypothetical protein
VRASVLSNFLLEVRSGPPSLAFADLAKPINIFRVQLGRIFAEVLWTLFLIQETSYDILDSDYANAFSGFRNHFSVERIEPLPQR